MIRFVAFALLVLHSLTFKLFMFGSQLTDDSNPAYKRFASQIGKPTRPNCDQNWDTTDCPRVAVITSGSPDTPSANSQSSKTIAFFKDLGMAPKHFSVQIDNYKQSTNVFDFSGYHYFFWAQQVDLFYFNGGDPSKHIRSWLNDDGLPNPVFSQIKRRILNSKAIVVTVAEGASALTKTVFGGGSTFGKMYFSHNTGLALNTISSGNYLKDLRNGSDCLLYRQNGGKMKGLSLVDFVVDTNFDNEGKLGSLVPALVDLGQNIGIGIDEHTCLYFQDGVGTVYGQNGVFITDISQSLKTESEYFHLKNVILHYLSSGDTFNFKTKTLTTAKKTISPDISGFSDSNDILASYESTRLLTRLIEQIGLQNLGRTKIPVGKGYPQSTPIFSLLFYKDVQTMGYKSGTSYAAKNIHLDYSAQTRM